MTVSAYSAYAFTSQEKVRSGELSSANAHACARGLAQMGNIIVTDGKDSDLISAETCAKMHAEPKKAADAAIRGKKYRCYTMGNQIFLAFLNLTDRVTSQFP